ncbi:MAG: hypothetical protein WBG08_05725, partial [Litorimonas sp.]
FDPRRAIAHAPPFPGESQPQAAYPGLEHFPPPAPYPDPQSFAQGYPPAQPSQPIHSNAAYAEPAYAEPAYAEAPGFSLPPMTAEAEADALARRSLLSRFRKAPGAGTDPVAPGTVQPAPAVHPEGAMPPSGARKPFVIGLLTGITLMLLLGQVFRVVDPTPDYSYVPPTFAQPDLAANEDDGDAVAFLDTVEGLEP